MKEKNNLWYNYTTAPTVTRKQCFINHLTSGVIILNIVNNFIQKNIYMKLVIFYGVRNFLMFFEFIFNNFEFKFINTFMFLLVYMIKNYNYLFNFSDN